VAELKEAYKETIEISKDEYNSLLRQARILQELRNTMVKLSEEDR